MNLVENLNNKRWLKFLLKDTFIYGGAYAISKLFSLITVPLMAKHFSLAEYGILDYFFTLSNLFTIIYIFGQDSAVARFFYEYDATEDRCQVISQSLIFQLMVLILTIPILWYLANWISNYLVKSAESVVLFKIMLFQIPFLLLINFTQNILKWTFSRNFFLVATLGYSIMQAILVTMLITLYNATITDIMWSLFITSMIFASLGIYFIREWIVVPKNITHVLEMLPFAIPYGIICVCSASLPTLERTYINYFFDTESMGIYAMAAKIASLIALIVGAFQVAWGPYSLSLMKKNDAIHFYNTVLDYFVICICIMVLVISLLAQPLIYTLSSEIYYGSVVIVYPLVLALAIQAISWITDIGIGFSKRSYLNLITYPILILISLLFIWQLAPFLGLLGVGVGVLVGHISKALLVTWLSQKAYPLKWNYKPVLFIIPLTIIIFPVAIWLKIKYSIFHANILFTLAILLFLRIGWVKITKLAPK